MLILLNGSGKLSLNVILSGDFYQLDPPSGTSLAAIPASWIRNAKKYAPGATEDHGHGKVEACGK